MPLTKSWMILRHFAAGGRIVQGNRAVSGDQLPFLEDRLIKQFIQKESSLAEDSGWGMPSTGGYRRLKKVSRIRAPVKQKSRQNPVHGAHGCAWRSV